MPATGALVGLPPVIGRDCRILVLGSFPGAASLAAGHYYAHPRNQFWPIISAVLGADLTTIAFAQRYRAVRQAGIGIWDVLGACRRAGSLDSAIRDPRANDFSELARRAPRLQRVLFNGGTAARHARALERLGYEVLVLPSTSPAHAARSLAQKLALWAPALRLEDEPR